jgi:hypothetical protein
MPPLRYSFYFARLVLLQQDLEYQLLAPFRKSDAGIVDQILAMLGAV